ncbi:uncharacterized protein LOC132865727 [Neoarius graeffei]|uniref:uncharacterized protein LOC132865727 n=1 Tax=Neoarius graeffei TaxID=443677 RepID=UPI00298D451C|nr:uncharacterized protein LOC132865727 [Neoarius graeffei]
MRAASQTSATSLQASYQVALLVTKAKKPYMIAEELIAPAEPILAETMVDKKAADAIQSVPLSNDTICRRVDEMAGDIVQQVTDKLKGAGSFAVQLDESTDVNGEAQLVMFARFKDDTVNDIVEHIVFCKPLPDKTTGEDIFNLIVFFTEHELDWKCCSHVCTDGAASMTGWHRGLVSRIRQVNPDIQGIHCIIHREALASKRMSPELDSVLTDAAKVINFIKSRPLNSRLFHKLCEEMGSDHHQLLLHTDVRWLSRGKALQRLFELRDQVHDFLSEHGHPLAAQLEDQTWLAHLAYLTDVFGRLNELNTSLQALPEAIVTLSDFLEQRGVPTESVQRLEEEKIDKDVIRLMEDRELAKYISSYGDRLAVTNFCKNQTSAQRRKMGLFEKLRAKMQLQKEGHGNKPVDEVPKSTSSQSHPRRRGRQSHRKIEIGWLNREKGQAGIKQMRAKQGGGTRMVDVNVECRMNTILEKGKELFFPNGMSTKGHEKQFNFEIWDYKHNPVNENVTVGLIYDTLCMNRLRFYIATFPKEDIETDYAMDSEDVIEDEPVIEIADDNDAQLIHTYVLDLDHEIILGPSSGEYDGDNDDTEPFEFPILQQPTTADAFRDDELQLLPSVPLAASDPPLPSMPLSMPLAASGLQLAASDLLLPSKPKLIVIHHGNCLNEMISEFMDPAVLTQPLTIKRLLPDNTEEKAVGSGVLRDVFSSFWQEFYDRCTIGTDVKIPFIRHDYSSETWKAIGRVLVVGYKTCDYLPIKLALPLLE